MLFIQTQEWEFSKKGKLCEQAAFGIHLCYGLTVRSSCLFRVAMESSMVDSFSSSQSSEATSWGNSAYQEEKISIIKWNLITQITMKHDARQKNQSEPFWPLVLFL